MKYTEMSFDELSREYDNLIAAKRSGESVSTSMRMVETAFLTKYTMERFLEDFMNYVVDSCRDARRFRNTECIASLTDKEEIYSDMMRCAADIEMEEEYEQKKWDRTPIVVVFI